MFNKTHFSSYNRNKIFVRSLIFTSKATNNDKEVKMETMVVFPAVLLVILGIWNNFRRGGWGIGSKNKNYTLANENTNIRLNLESSYIDCNLLNND